MSKISETYILGIDISEEDEACVSVCKNTGTKLVMTNVVFGDEAIELYEKLTKKSIRENTSKSERGKQNE